MTEKVKDLPPETHKTPMTDVDSDTKKRTMRVRWENQYG